METLLGDNDFLGTIRDLVVSSGRASSNDSDRMIASTTVSATVSELAATVQELKPAVNRSKSGKVVDQKTAGLERSISGRVLDDNKHVVEIGFRGQSLGTAM